MKLLFAIIKSNRIYKTVSFLMIISMILTGIFINSSSFENFNTASVSSKGLTATLKKTVYTYTGKAVKPTPVVRYNGKKLSSKYYTVKYDKRTKNIGTHKIRIICTGTYKRYGSKTIRYKVVPKKTVITKAVVNGKTVKLTYKASKGVTTYQIQYANDSKFTTGKKTVTCKNVLKYLNLEYGKTYYIRVRGYKTISGKRYISDWSNVKKAIIPEYGSTESPTESNTSTEQNTSTETPVKSCEHNWVVDVPAHYEWQNLYDENGKQISHDICQACGCDLTQLYLNEKAKNPNITAAEVYQNHQDQSPNCGSATADQYVYCGKDKDGNWIDHPHKGSGVGMDTYIPDTYKCSKCGAKVYWNEHGEDYNNYWGGFKWKNVYLLQKYGKNIDYSKLAWIYEDVNNQTDNRVKVIINGKTITAANAGGYK